MDGRKLAIATALACAAVLAGGGSAGAEQTWGGHKITFVSPRGGGSSDLFVMNEDGSHQVNLTPGTPFSEDTPSISPNGKRIIFSAFGKGGDDDELFVVSSHGGKVRNLTKNDGFDFDAAWSPDGKQIAYVCAKAGMSAGLCVMTLKTGHVRRVTHGAHDLGSPTWSPDGQEIAFRNLAEGAGYTDIYTIHADGSHERRLTKTDAQSESQPSWSPDGKHIAIDAAGGIELISAKTGKMIDGPFPGGEPSWSPDGKHLDYYDYDGHDGEIWRANPDGSHRKNLTDNEVEDYFSD
jgi:Tol biopolymer transport system component